MLLVAQGPDHPQALNREGQVCCRLLPAATAAALPAVAAVVAAAFPVAIASK